MTSKSQRKARRRAITLAGGQSIPQPATQGARRDLKPAQDPRIVALAARERITGLIGAEALAPEQGDDMGRCIVHLCSGQDRADLLNLWRGLTGSRENYLTRYIGQTGHPKGAAFGFISDEIKTDQSLRVDLRTRDERDLQAVASWGAWLAKIKALPLGHKWAMQNALGLSLGAVCLWQGQRPTKQGVASVAALRAVHTMG